MRKIILSGIHCTGKTTIAKKLIDIFSKQNLKVRLYSLDNFRIYRNENPFTSQIDRLYFGNQKLKEAYEEQPEIAIFDRNLTDNIFYSKAFNHMGQLSDTELTSIIRIYQSLESRKNIFDCTILFLNPPFEELYQNILKREREKGTILEDYQFLSNLHQIYNQFYENYYGSPVFTFTEYDEHQIIDKLIKNDFLQSNYD